jgi:polar amino acid transport system permease protein
LLGPERALERAYGSAVLALGLNSGAYQTEIIRSGIQAIPSGQMEAGRSIGLTYLQTMRYIILPQAIRIVIPPLGNETVNLVLNSSLASVIGFGELTRRGKLLISLTFETFWTWTLVLMFYFVITYTLSTILKYLEKRLKIPGLGLGGEE